MLIAICDDSAEARSELFGYLDKYALLTGAAFELDACSSAEELLHKATHSEQLPAVVFLDIYMGGSDGMTAAKKLRADGYRGEIIFTTASTEHAIEGYSVGAIGYLLKPYTYDDLAAVMNSAKKRLKASYKTITIVADRIEHTIAYKDILYVETDGRYSAVCTTTGRLLCRRSLMEFQKELCAEPYFLRCHRSCIVNINHIMAPFADHIDMKNGDTVLINIKESLRIRQKIADYLGSVLLEEQ